MQILAALGVAQLERLDEFVVRKRKMGALYSELLQDIPGLQLPLNKTSFAENIYWVYGILLDDSMGLDAKNVIKKLSDKGVGSRPFFYPMHQQPVLRSMGLFEGETHPVSENMYGMAYAFRWYDTQC